MDEDSYKTLIYVRHLMSHINMISFNIGVFVSDLPVPKRREPKNLDELKNNLVGFQSSTYFPKLINELKELNSWLSTNKIECVDFEQKALIKEIDEIIEKLFGEKLGVDDGYWYSDEMITRTLYRHLDAIIDKFYKIVMRLVDFLNESIKSINKNQELYHTDFPEDIKKNYDSLIAATENDAKEFLLSSNASLRYGIIQYRHSLFSSVFVHREFKEDIKENLISYLLSSLFLLNSAYEKIIFSIGYYLGSKKSHDDMKYFSVLGEIKDKNNQMHKEIVNHIRYSEIKIIRDWRNASTHKVSDIKFEEIKGKIVTLIEEISRLLRLYLNLLEHNQK